MATPTPPLPYSLRSLARATGIHFGQLRAMVRNNRYHYHAFDRRKPSGGRRPLYSLDESMLGVQRFILARYLEQLEVHPAAFAYRRGRSALDCARIHLASHTVIRIDIEDFYGSIRERAVYKVFRPPWAEDARRFRLPARYAYEVTRLCTIERHREVTRLNRGRAEMPYPYADRREGHVPQGGATSGYLSNLVFADLDQQICSLAESSGLRYARYSDDMFFSSTDRVPEDVTSRLIGGVEKMLGPYGFHLNHAKTRVAGPGARRLVLGVLVDRGELRLTPQYKRQVDLHLWAIRRHGITQHAEHRNFKSEAALITHLEGLVSYAKGVELAWAQEREAEIARIALSMVRQRSPGRHAIGTG